MTDLTELEGMPYGVKMILKQGLLDHWFSEDSWGAIRPSLGAFDLAVEGGWIERHFQHPGRYRLTDKGRVARHHLERIGGSPAGEEILRARLNEGERG